MAKQKGNNPTIEVHKERAREVFRPLVQALESREKLFINVSPDGNAPQRICIPEGMTSGSLDHRRLQYFSAMTDRRESSLKVYNSHKELWERGDSFLYSEKVLEMSSKEIWKLLSNVKVGSPRQSAKYWPMCAKTLFGDFGGDPLEIFKRFGTIDEILAFKNNGRGNILPGFGPKILSLLSLFYAELELMDMPPDAFPVDVHIQRLAISTGILTGTGRVFNEQVESNLRPLLCEVCAEEELNRISASHAGWFTGNLGCHICHRYPAIKHICPIYGYCGGAIASNSYFRKGWWDLDAPWYHRGGDREGSKHVFLAPSSAPLFTAL